MSDTDKQVAEEKTKQKKDVKKKAAAKKDIKPSTSHSNSSVFILIFLVAIATAAGFFYLWEKQQQSYLQQNLVTQKLEQQLASFEQQQLTFTANNNEQIKKIYADQENLTKNFTKLIRDNQHLRNDWLLAEAEYLIQLANYRLLLEKDATTAAIAIQAADSRLNEVSDPALLSVRKILANDLQALLNVPTLDLAGMSIRLSSLSNNIEKLPLRTPDPKTHKINQADKANSSEKVDSIKDLPAAIWKDIKNLVIIRNHQKPLEPLLAPKQHFFLVQNLALLLEQSRFALLNGHNAIYHERLKTTEDWVKQYFDVDHNVTINMLTSLAELQQININPTLPDISSTFSVIKKYREKRELPVETVKKENDQAKEKP